MCFVVLFSNMPCMKRVYRDKWATVHCSAARNEERFSSRGSTGRFVPLPVYIGFPLFVLSKSRSGELSSVLCWARGTNVLSASQTVDVRSGPARPGPAAAPCTAPPRPARGMSGFWTRQVYDLFPDTLGMKRLCRDTKATMSARQLLTNRG